MTMIKRGTSKSAVAGIVKEKKGANNYCCAKCKKCFSSIEEMERHNCSK